MTEQVPSLAIDGAVTPTEIVPNPPTGAPKDFFDYLYNDLLLPAGTALVKAEVQQTVAVGNAKAQTQINQYRKTDPSIGPNDPRAALAYESQTLAQKWLPSWMLVSAGTLSTTDGKTVEQKKISGLGWGILAILALLFVWLFIRLFRR